MHIHRNKDKSDISNGITGSFILFLMFLCILQILIMQMYYFYSLKRILKMRNIFNKSRNNVTSVHSFNTNSDIIELNNFFCSLLSSTISYLFLETVWLPALSSPPSSLQHLLARQECSISKMMTHATAGLSGLLLL